uniref:Uncharacterized protein n=1 Tax=Triticum urartu TaxID=4572 RepID=A0A8R7QPR0_TRIUA
MARAATSCARAAISAVAKVPSQMRDFLRGSRISDTHLPQLRMRTPRYVGCRPSLRGRFFLDDAVVAVGDGGAARASAEDDVVVSEPEEESSVAPMADDTVVVELVVGGVMSESVRR